VEPYHRHLEEGSKVQHSLDLPPVLLPSAQVVSQPLANILARTSKGGASDDHRTASGPPFQQSLAGCSRHLSAVQVVHIKLNVAIVVNDVGVESEVRESTVSFDSVLVVDLIVRVQVVPTRGANVLCFLTLRKGRTLVESALSVGRSVSGEPWRCVGDAVSGIRLSTRLELRREARDLSRLRTECRARWWERTGFRGVLGVCVEGVEVGGLVHVDPQSIDVDSGLGVEE
jgi:hypothetical protein